MSHFHDIALAPETIAQAREGDVSAREAIYRAYANAVYTLARRLVSRPAVAEEMLQDTFVEVLRSLPSYRGDGSFSGWVRAIAVSKCLHYLRSPWHRRLRWLDATAHDDASVLDIPDSTPQPDAQVGGHADLERALQALAPTARTVVWLHDVEGYTHAEIARLLQRTPSFSKSQLARAHERLRAVFDPIDEALICTPISTNC
ncbi:MAG: sigma-70 family RNA polymerase sigma factor [Steroidobacteraceae bacterium]